MMRFIDLRNCLTVCAVLIYAGLAVQTAGHADDQAPVAEKKTSSDKNAKQIFVVSPENVELAGDFARAQLIVSTVGAAGPHQNKDLTLESTFVSSNPDVVSVQKHGRLQAIGNGSATITITARDQTQTISVTVSEFGQRKLSFIRDVRPIINKVGCASAACHASQHGKGGFKLSVFGYDPQEDYESIVKACRGRRVNFASVDASLILQKPSMQMPHKGGERLPVGSTEYQILKRWIQQGAAAPDADDASVTNISVEPARRLARQGATQQLRVVAHYSDDTSRDVTALATYDSTDEGTLTVNQDGLVTTAGKGQAAIMVRFEGQAEIAMFVIPYSTSVQLTGWSNNNFVDELAANKFRELGLEPSPLCDDATFIRRAFLDAIGTLPKPEQVQAFIESSDPGKRELLVDELLGLAGDPEKDIYNDQYAAFWTLKWSDLIRNNSNSVGEQGMWSLHNWIRESFRTNKPFDQFVSELVTAKGSIYSNGPANYFRINANSSSLTESTAQLFMGVRLECAKCHHHPFEKYSQADYYQLAAFFSRVGSKNSEEFGLFGRETVVVVRSSGDVNHPRTGKRMEPTPLGGEPIDDPLDRRIPLAKWLTSSENEFFARSVVNRYTGYLLGRGLVEPIDDMRSTNPPSNAELLDALASDFINSGYDLKHLVRTIMTSRLYQLSSQQLTENASDRRFFSHYRVKRLAAEPLLDAIDQVTAVQTKFKNLPLGTRAIDLPDAEYPNYFLTTFAKPRRASVCECERPQYENLSQALHTLNGDTLATKIADKNGTVAKLVAEKIPHEDIVKQLYMLALCRPASAGELAASNEFLEESESPTEYYEDLLWSLINSKQFLFVR